MWRWSVDFRGMRHAGTVSSVQSATKRNPVEPCERALLAVLVLAWTAGLVAVLSHTVFVTNDSLSNYAHVWYVSKALYAGHGLPLHFPALGHGDALAFPYAFIPWTSAAVLRPAFGDWITTLWLVLGGAGTIGATLWAFPELRTARAAAILLANPLMVEAVILGQLPFLWGAAFWFVAVGLWRKHSYAAAVVMAALAQAGHPAVVLPLAGLTVLGWLPFEAQRWRLFLLYSLSVVLAAPAIAMVLVSPVVEDSTTYSLAANFLGTVSLRAGVMLGPFLVVLLDRHLPRPAMLAFAFAVLALNAILVPIRHTGYAWHAFTRTPDTVLVPFLQSPGFRPGDTYRILRVADGKVGMYQLIQHGANLDAELFPESIDRRSWPTTNAYLAFLRGRKVDDVIIFDTYDARYGTNEHALLAQLGATGCATLTVHNDQFDVYHLAQHCT